MSRLGDENTSNHDPGLRNTGAQQHADVNAAEQHFRRLYRLHSLQSREPGEYTSELTRSPRPKIFVQLPYRQEEYPPGGRDAGDATNDETLRAAEGLARIRTSAPIEMGNGIRVTSKENGQAGVVRQNLTPGSVQSNVVNTVPSSHDAVGQNQIVKNSLASGNQQNTPSGGVGIAQQDMDGQRVSRGQQGSPSLKSPTPGRFSNQTQGSNNQQTNRPGVVREGPNTPVSSSNWSAVEKGGNPVTPQQESFRDSAGPVPQNSRVQTVRHPYNPPQKSTQNEHRPGKGHTANSSNTHHPKPDQLSKPSGSTTTQQPPSLPVSTTAITPVAQRRSQHPSGISTSTATRATAGPHQYAAMKDSPRSQTALTPQHEPVPGSVMPALQFIRGREVGNANTSRGSLDGGSNSTTLKANGSAPLNNRNGALVLAGPPPSERAQKEDNANGATKKPETTLQGLSPSIGRESAATDLSPKNVSSAKKTNVQPIQHTESSPITTSTPGLSERPKASPSVIINEAQHRIVFSSKADVGNGVSHSGELGASSKPMGGFERKQALVPGKSPGSSMVDQNAVTKLPISTKSITEPLEKGSHSTLAKKPEKSSESRRLPLNSSPQSSALDGRTGKVASKPTSSTQVNAPNNTGMVSKPALVPVRTKTTGQTLSIADDSDPRIRYVKEIARQLSERQKMNKGELSKSLESKPDGNSTATANSQAVQRASSEDLLLNQVAARAAETLSPRTGKTNTSKVGSPSAGNQGVIGKFRLNNL